MALTPKAQFTVSALMDFEGACVRVCVCVYLCVSRGVFIFSAPFWGSVMQCVHKHGTFSSVVLSNTANAGKCGCSNFYPSVSLGKESAQRKQGRWRMTLTTTTL